MTNAELIKALQCASHFALYQDCYEKNCYANSGKGLYCNIPKLIAYAADALEAAEKRIAELMPKEGEWIVTTEVSDDGAVTSHINCSRCGFYWREPKHGKVFKRCPNCGAKMKGEQE